MLANALGRFTLFDPEMIVTHLEPVETTDGLIEHLHDPDTIHSVAVMHELHQGAVHFTVAQALFLGAHDHRVTRTGDLGPQQ